MAEGKKSFLLYADIIYTIEHLTNEEKGILFQHLLDYVNDKKPVIEDRIILIAWKPIERQLKRDLDKYENKKEERSKSGQLGNLKRYYPDLYKRVKSDELDLEAAQDIAKHRNASHSDTKLAVNDTGNVNGNVNDTDINNIYEKFVDEVRNHNFDSRIESLYMRLKLKKGTLTPLLIDFKLHIIEENRLHKTTEEYFINFKNWLNKQDSLKKLDKYKN